MANSKQRKPFRSLGLRMLSLSRQIIQTYAATDPIARQLLPRATEEPNYEPIEWDEGYGFEDDTQTPDADGYQSMFDDMPPNPQTQRPSRPAQQSTQQPSQPVQRKPQQPNPKGTVDVGGVKVPSHVVAAFKNHQARKAQRSENIQRLADDASQMDQDSILAKRQQRGRGMSVDYMSTDVLRRDDGQSAASNSSSESESDDSDSPSEASMSNSPPTSTAPIMRDMADDSDTSADFVEADYDDETTSPEQGEFAAPSASQPAIQRTYYEDVSDNAQYDDAPTSDLNYFDDDADEDYSTQIFSSDDSSSESSPTAPSNTSGQIQRVPNFNALETSSEFVTFDSEDEPSLFSDFEAPATNIPSIRPSQPSNQPIQRTSDFDDDDYAEEAPDVYSDFDSADVDAPITQSRQSNQPIQRTSDFDSDSSEEASDLYTDFDSADVDAPITQSRQSNQPIQRTSDFDDADVEDESDLYSDFDSTDVDTPVTQSRSSNQPIQRTSDFDDDYAADEPDLYSDFDSADVDTPVTQSRQSNQPIQRAPDFDDDYSEDEPDLYSDFDSADVDTPITQNRASNQPIQRAPDFDDDYSEDEPDLYSDFDSADVDTPVTQNRQSNQPIQRTSDFDDDYAEDVPDLYSDFGSTDVDTPVTQNRASNQPIQRAPDFDALEESASEFVEFDSGSDVAPEHSVRQANQPIQRSPFDNELGQTPPLASPIIEDDYYDFSLQTDRMKPITSDDIAAYDARKATDSTPSSAPNPIQRSPIQDTGFDDADEIYDGDIGFDNYSGMADTGQMNLHEALYSAGAIDSPPSSPSKIQRSQSLFDDFADNRSTPETQRPDLHEALYSAGVVDRPPRNSVQRQQSLYDDLAPDNSEAVYNTSDAGDNSVQRTPDNNGMSGDLKSDLLNMMGLPANTSVGGFNEVFGGASNNQQAAQPNITSSSQPSVQRQIIERSVEPPPDIQRAITIGSHRASSNDNNRVESSESSDDDKGKIEQMAQEVYKKIKGRLRTEWERRNRF